MTATFNKLTSDSESELLYRQISSSWRQTPWDSRQAFFFQLNTCGYSPYGTSSLKKGWVCPLQLLLVLASAVILRSESHGTRDYILLSQIRYFHNLELGPCIYIPQEQGGPVIPPGTGFRFRRHLRTRYVTLARITWETPLSTFPTLLQKRVYPDVTMQRALWSCHNVCHAPSSLDSDIDHHIFSRNYDAMFQTGDVEGNCHNQSLDVSEHMATQGMTHPQTCFRHYATSGILNSRWGHWIFQLT
jgi:hypothetical protein